MRTEAKNKNSGRKSAAVGRPLRSAFLVQGMDCPDELRMIEDKLRPMEGVLDLEANFLEGRLVVFHEPSLPVQHIARAIRQAGFDAVFEEEHVGPRPAPRRMFRQVNWWPIDGKGLLALASGVLLLAATAVHFAWGLPAVVDVLLLAAIIGGGYKTARNGLRSAWRLNFDTSFLMTVAVAGAVAVHELFEGAAVVALFSLAQWLELKTMDRARDAIRKLLDLSPKEALVIRGGEERRVPVEDVRVGEMLVIRPGEKIPLDGEVTEGVSYVDESAVTGESLPVEKSAGASVFAGSVNQHGALTIRSTRQAGDTTLAKVIHMVEEAQSRRAPSQRFVDRFSRVYTPAVLVGAVLVASVPPLLFGGVFAEWFYQALVLLVIACPCALVISTPVTIVCALVRAARSGVLIKGGAHLENVGKLDTLIFDKTGTLTQGKAQVVDVLPLNNVEPMEILRVAAAVESHSEHHLARAVTQKAAAEGLTFNRVSNFAALPGRGASAELDGRKYYVGSVRLFNDLGCDTSAVEAALLKNESAGKAVVLVGTNSEVSGAIVLADTIRPAAKDALAKLRALGIDDFIMLTGDNEGTAQAIAEQLGMDHYHAGLLPENKVREVKEALDEHKLAAMVGDGVNDAPALAASTVGIAMGTAGTDAALETADVALMADDLEKLPYLVSLGRKTLAIIRENIALALLIKALVIGLTIAGVASLWAAVAADMGASLLVIFNGMRMLNFEER